MKLFFFAAFLLIMGTMGLFSYTNGAPKTFVFHKEMTQNDVDDLVKKMKKSNMKVHFHELKFNEQGELASICATIKHGSSMVRFSTDCVGKIYINKSFMQLNLIVAGESSVD
jgi:hypothetical protein